MILHDNVLKRAVLFFCMEIGVYIAITFGYEFGKFDMSITEVVLCKGPKTTNCTSVEIDLLEHRVMSFRIKNLKPVKLTFSKISVLNNGKPFVRMHMDNPCSHVFLKPIFQKFLNITDKCVIPMGDFKYNIDVVNIAATYFAKEFVYGNFTFKSTFYSSDCNFVCVRLETSITPRN